RHGAEDRRRRAVYLPRRVDKRFRRRPCHARGRYGEALRHRHRARSHRHSRAASRRLGRCARPPDRVPLSRHSRASHLRRRVGGAEGHHRPPNAHGGAAMSAHVDTFVRDNLPPLSQQAEFKFTLPELQFPAQYNASSMLDAAIANGYGKNNAVLLTSETLNYEALLEEASRIAHV